MPPHQPPQDPSDATAPSLIRLRPPNINQDANALDDEAASLIVFLNKVRASLVNFAGTDQYARTFLQGTAGHPGYEEHERTAEAAIHDLADAYSNTATGLREMANNLQAADWTVAANLPSLSQ